VIESPSASQPVGEAAPSPAASSSLDAKQAERRARRNWVGVILGLLGFCLVTQFSFLYIAGHDPSSVAEPDYYAKAVAWEDHQRQESVNRGLGWVATLELSALQW
jgi:hypothetical protein